MKIASPCLRRLASPSWLLAGLSVALWGCADPAPSSSGGRSRSDALSASPSQASSVNTAAAAPPSAAARKPRAVCTKPPSADGKELSEVLPDVLVAEGETQPASFSVGGGKWTWVNLWASWCGPCKEEMPMLVALSKKEAGLFRMAYVSIDDDERLALRFLASQPVGGVRSSYYLKSGESRDKWLASAGIGEVSKLPVHLLVDPDKRIRCAIHGAVEEAELAAITAFMKR